MILEELLDAFKIKIQVGEVVYRKEDSSEGRMPGILYDVEEIGKHRIFCQKFTGLGFLAKRKARKYAKELAHYLSEQGFEMTQSGDSFELNIDGYDSEETTTFWDHNALNNVFENMHF